MEKLQKQIKDRLNSYTALERERLQLSDQLARLQARLQPGGQNMDGMPKAPGAGDSLANLVAERIDLETKYKGLLLQLVRAQADIENLIDGLEPTERTLARFRYLDGHTWEQVCLDMSYSWRQVHRIHGRLLDKLAADAKSKAIFLDI